MRIACLTGKGLARMNRSIKKVIIVKYVYPVKGFRGSKQYVFYGVLLLIICNVLSCATYTPASRDAEGLPVPEAFTLYQTTAPAPEQWWEAFGSDELNALMEKALGDNLSLRQVYARLEQSRYLMQQANAALFPSVNLGGDASMTNRHKEDTGTTTTRNYGFGSPAAMKSTFGGVSGRNIRRQQQRRKPPAKICTPPC